MPLAIREGDQLKPNPLQSRSAYKLSCRRGGEKGAAGRDGRMGRTGENRRGGGSGRKERGSVDGRKEETPSVAATLLLQLPGPQGCLAFELGDCWSMSCTLQSD